MTRIGTCPPCREGRCEDCWIVCGCNHYEPDDSEDD